MSDLAQEPVEPARPGTAPLDGAGIAELLPHLDEGWTVTDGALVRRYGFPDFARALAFVNAIGALAEAVQHHPDIAFGWGSATLTWTTHDIGGLGRSDFVMAARSDREFREGGHAG
ncbi:MAG: 4a-hydroxytetrahydrobiopterin dehydratase [Myxococcota bacterium]